MAICKYFQAGNCRFGCESTSLHLRSNMEKLTKCLAQCRFEHPGQVTNAPGSNRGNMPSGPRGPSGRSLLYKSTDFMITMHDWAFGSELIFVQVVITPGRKASETISAPATAIALETTIDPGTAIVQQTTTGAIAETTPETIVGIPQVLILRSSDTTSLATDLSGRSQTTRPPPRWPASSWPAILS